MDFLRNHRFLQVVTFVSFFSAIVLIGWAGHDMKDLGIDKPAYLRSYLFAGQIDCQALKDSLVLRGADETEVRSWSCDKTHQKAIEYAGKTPVAHLARLVSGFSACIFLLMFWFLYQRRRLSKDESEQNQPEDYSMLFFGLAMLTWALPTEPVFRTFESLKSNAKALADSRAFLNSIFFICAYWDLEHKMPGRWIRFFESFQLPTWWKRFVSMSIDANYKRGTFVFLMSLLTVVMLFLFFSGNAKSKGDTKVVLWYDYFDFFFSVGFTILLIIAIIEGFRKRIQLPNNYMAWLGVLLGCFAASGFGIVLLFYYVDNPFYLPYFDFARSYVFQLVYQFLILFSVSVLAFSWAFDKKIKTLEEKTEILEAQRREIKHFSRNVLSQFQKELNMRFGQFDKNDTFKIYIEERIEDIKAYLESSIIGINDTKINLPERLEDCIAKFKKIFDLKFDLKNDLLFHSEYDAENSLKLIQVINELMFNAKKHGGGIESVIIEEKQEQIRVSVTNKMDYFDLEFEELVKNGFLVSDVYKFKNLGQGLKTLYWLMQDLDPKGKISIQGKSIILSINKNKIQK